jgi:CheY-like chemotaxis protein
MPDLLVSDILMPGLDGHQLLRRVRDDMRFKHLKVIFCTSSTEQSDIEKASAEGVNRYLIKPYNPEAVIHTIEEELATRTDYVEVAQKRLNMEREEFLIIARSLSDEASKTVIDARKEFANGQHPLARIRLNALKGACLTLGSEELAARAELLCQAIDSGRLSHIMGEFDALEKLVLQFHDTINMMSRTKHKHKKQPKAEPAPDPASSKPTTA